MVAGQRWVRRRAGASLAARRDSSPNACDDGRRPPQPWRALLQTGLSSSSSSPAKFEFDSGLEPELELDSGSDPDPGQGSRSANEPVHSSTASRTDRADAAVLVPEGAVAPAASRTY